MFFAADMAYYDEKRAAYVLPEGEYTILVGNSVRSLAATGRFVNEKEKITEQVRNRCVPRKLLKRLKADGSYEELAMGEYPALYDTADLPGKPSGGAEHILPNTDGINIPKDRLNFEKVVSGDITLDEFLNGLTDEELITLLGGTHNRGVADTWGIGGLNYLGIPAVMTADGPAGLRLPADRGVKTTAWPVATLLACTWDSELVYQVGEAAAKEIKENNIGMWLAPAINIHRSPLCGRNFEYYSEDPLVAGKLAASMVRGIQSQNIAACVKHFCCNNKETNRYGSDSRVSERALREIYLKAFEIVVKEGGAWCIMTAYNLLNGIYTSENRELISGILREEWRYDGLVVTDWGNWAEHYRETLAGNNVRMPYGSLKRLQAAFAQELLTRYDLIENARYVLTWLMRLE